MHVISTYPECNRIVSNRRDSVYCSRITILLLWNLVTRQIQVHIASAYTHNKLNTFLTYICRYILSFSTFVFIVWWFTGNFVDEMKYLCSYDLPNGTPLVVASAARHDYTQRLGSASASFLNVAVKIRMMLSFRRCVNFVIYFTRSCRRVV